MSSGDNNPEELTDEEIQALQEASYISSGDSSYGFPTASKKEDIFTFFKHILGMGDSSKTGNLSQTELGYPKVPVRAFQSIANYAEMEGLTSLGTFLRQEAEIILATSGSLKGFYPKLFVTQIKQEKRMSPQQQKQGFFGTSKNKKQQEMMQHGEI